MARYMKVRLKIERFDPARDKKPHFKEYTLDADTTDRVLDLLMHIKRYEDGTLAFRKSCAHGVCGSDAMRINDVERLACKVLVGDIVREENGLTSITVQPLKNLPVEKDLMVDQDEFFKRFRLIKPFLIQDKNPPEKEWIQTPDERKRIDDATKCILCASCYSACPVIRETNPEFLGPAQIVQAQRFNDDSRDAGFVQRLSILDKPKGVWPCENHFQCTKVCPRGIKVTRLINLTKRQIKGYREERGEKTNDGT
jgi:succinate dehydrogenase / fumarate reductase iron-sulfur subunit